MQKIYSVCDIHSPKQIQEMSLEELNHLAKEIRTFLIESGNCRSDAGHALCISLPRR